MLWRGGAFSSRLVLNILMLFLSTSMLQTVVQRENFFLKSMNHVLNSCSSEDYLFVGGDFNCTDNEVLDRNHAEPHPVSQHALRQLVSSHSLVDVWRRMHTSRRQYTWSHVRDNRIYLARLDRFYVFKHRLSAVKMCEILPVGFTDHCLVVCSLCTRNILHKSTYWHFNSVLTVNKSFREALSFFWSDFRQKQTEFVSLRQWWDHRKVQIKLLCQQHTLNVTRDVTRSIRDLEIDIVDLECESESTENRGYIEILKTKKMALASLLETKVQGALVRSRVQDIKEMDAPSSFFFGLERTQGQRRQIHSLLSEMGQELTEPGLIRKRAVEFYASLFKSDFKENEELMEEVCGGLPQISAEVNSQLDSPLTPQELYTALQSMQGRKAP